MAVRGQLDTSRPAELAGSITQQASDERSLYITQPHIEDVGLRVG
jgi:hypothetical protein